MDDAKLSKAAELLDAAWAAFEEDRNEALRAAALSKVFEVAFEYAWKSFKRRADDAGLEVYSPRDSIKAAAKLGMIDSPEVWNEFLNARNLSVHDDVGLDDERFAEVVDQFRIAVRELVDRGR